jgi:mannose-6-phosphate isomerase-like protein (cupin superfamily)
VNQPQKSEISKLPGFVTTALVAFAKSITQTPPHQILHDGKSDYLHRWYLERTRETGSVYVHKILRSDADEELHDHPGDNMSIILEGEMIEVMEQGQRILVPGDVILRPAEFRHRLILENPVTTIWIMGERIREWGFWSKDGQFMPWRKFVARR